MEQIPVCVRYNIDGTETNRFPFPTLLEKAKPVTKYLPGWQCDISNARRWEDLPREAQHYVEYVENAIGCHITYISVGAERDAIILR